MFAHPPIAIHHDYSKCHLDPATLPSHVRIVKEWVATAWGTWSLVEAYLAALRLLHSENAPEWTVNLSGTDYPIKSAEYILDDLRSSSADAFLDYREISRGCVQSTEARSLASCYKEPGWLLLARKRYLYLSVVHYHLRKFFGRGEESVYVYGDRPFVNLLTPFSRGFRPFAGDWWHTVHARAVRVLLTESASSRKLRRFYSKRPVPDESYLHTLLLNEPTLNVENDNRRYALWSSQTLHPEFLRSTDIPRMVASNAHFARKFPFDLDLYRAVDAQVDDPRSCAFDSL